MAKSQVEKNREYRAKHQLVRIELLVKPDTKARFEAFRKSNPVTMDQALLLLLDSFSDSNPVTTDQVQAVDTDSNPVTAVEPVAEVSESNPVTTETAKQQAQRLLDQAGNSLSEAQALLKAELKSMFPGVAINPKPVHGSAEHDLFKRYDSVQKQLKKLSKPK